MTLEDLLGEDRAHVRELDEVLGARVCVGARVEQDRGAALGGNDDADRRAHHAGEAAEGEQAGREHRARVPGGDDRVRVVFADRAAGGDERAVRLRLHGLRRLLVHADRLGRLDELEALRIEAGRTEQDRLDLFGGRVDRAGDHLFRPAVTPQRVDRDADHYGAGVRSGSISRPAYVLQTGHIRCGRLGEPH